MRTKIDVNGPIATISVEVNLDEWNDKFPGAHAVLGRAIANLETARDLDRVKPSDLTSQIVALQDKLSNLANLQPEVIGA